MIGRNNISGEKKRQIRTGKGRKIAMEKKGHVGDVSRGDHGSMGSPKGAIAQGKKKRNGA